MRLRSLSGRHGRAAAVLVALAALHLGAGPAQAAEKAIWGPVTLPDGRSAMPVYEELGIDTLQLGMSWADIAPQRPARPTDPADPAYRWPAELAAAESEATRRAIKLALLVSTAPPWANGGKAPIQAPDNPQDYADFVTAAARRYPSVRRWMIWGEPNRDDRFQPNRPDDPVGPRSYARLLDAAYGALKARSPANRVIGGMTWTGGTVKPADFLRKLRLANGRPPRLDWYGHNPFPYRFPRLSEPPIGPEYRDMSDTDTLSREVARTYGRPVPLWLSEYTIQSDHGSSSFATFTTRASQARYVTAGFQIADDLAGAVAGLGWFSLLDEPAAPQSANWGLLTSSSQRKPAFAAFVRAPSERLRPVVRVAARVKRGALRASGLAVRVTPRVAGSIAVELRRGARVVARGRARGAARSTSVIRLRATLRAGRYTVAVRAARSSTVRRAVRVG